jgi:hypothetical protein
MSDELWTRERLESMIAQKIEESNQLDYKSAPALEGGDNKKTAITKDVSAFANSAGGQIIYGIKEFEDVARKHLPEKIDAIDSRNYSREWLDQIIGQISPRIEDVRIIPIRVGPAEWESCYVVDIPKGETSHQARDCRYYRRYNFESVAMVDYEVRDVMNRRKHPRLEFKICLIRTNEMTLKLSFFVKNVGPVIPKQYGVRVILPTCIGGKLFQKGLIRHQTEGKFFWWFNVIGGEPIFPGSEVYFEFEIPYLIGAPLEPTGDTVNCKLCADEMPPVTREIPVATALQGWV